MTRLRRRLKKLEAEMRVKQSTDSAQFFDVHTAALEKLSLEDRDLIRENGKGDSEAYVEMCGRWQAALTASARELRYTGFVHYTDLGWL